MKVPGFVVTALLVGAVAFLQSLSTGLEGLQETWWAPVLVVLADVAKMVEKQKKERGITRLPVAMHRNP
jgi:hypothetical protein